MYSARITRNNRTAFILLCDRSGSMAEEVVFEGERMTKADAVARIINMFMDELVNRCRREEGVRNYFDVAVIEYGGDGVIPLIPEKGGFITTSELIKIPVEMRTIHMLRRLPDGNQVTAAIRRRQWITPKACGDTPMGAALAEAERLVRAWCSRPCNVKSFPPVILNITDGEASDACYMELCDRAENIKNTGTGDGNTLLMNIHLMRRDETAPPVIFPCSLEELPANPYARLLWDMSSPMPGCYDRAICEVKKGGIPPFRAMSYSCTLNELFSMLTIGSVSGSVMS
jgi:Uncharacterized protein encoded in toxicity protection region of plasmid R478, contains von Willebrand factor (vWF) domain